MAAAFKRAFPILGGIASAVGCGYWTATKLMTAITSGGNDSAAAPGNAARLAPVASSLLQIAILGEGQNLDGMVVGRIPSAVADTTFNWHAFLMMLVFVPWLLYLYCQTCRCVVACTGDLFRAVTRARVVRLVACLMVLNRAWCTASEWLNVVKLVTACLSVRLSAALISWLPVLHVVVALAAATGYLRSGTSLEATTFEGLIPGWVKAWSLERRSYLDAMERSEQMQLELDETRGLLAESKRTAADTAAEFDDLAHDACEALNLLKGRFQDVTDLQALLGEHEAKLHRRSLTLSRCLSLVVYVAGKLVRVVTELQTVKSELMVARDEKESLRLLLESTQNELKAKSFQLQLIKARALRVRSNGTQTEKAPPTAPQSGFVFGVNRSFDFSTPMAVPAARTSGFALTPLSTLQEAKASIQNFGNVFAAGTRPAFVFDSAAAQASTAEAPSEASTPILSPEAAPVVASSEPQGEVVASASVASGTDAPAKVCWARPGVPCSKGSDCIGNPAEYDEAGEFLRGREGRFGATGTEGKKRKQQARKQQARKQKLCCDCFVKTLQE